MKFEKLKNGVKKAVKRAFNWLFDNDREEASQIGSRTLETVKGVVYYPELEKDVKKETEAPQIEETISTIEETAEKAPVRDLRNQFLAWKESMRRYDEIQNLLR